MNNISYLKIAGFAISIFCFFASCQKQEFMPAPIGEEVPAPIYPPLVDALSDQETLFKAIWQKADMDQVLAAEQAQVKLTVFVPDDKAMEEAGYDAAKIQSTTKEALQDIIRYHILNGTVSVEQIDFAGSGLSFPTILQHPVYLDGEKRAGSLLHTVPYRYKHQINVSEGTLLVDGKPLTVHAELPVAEGNMISIDQFLPTPEQQMYEFLMQDGRFSLYLKTMDINNEGYAEDFIMNWFARFPPPIRFLIDWNYFFEGTFHSSEEFRKHIIPGTLFAPTDQAFHALGIHTEADLRALNDRSAIPGSPNASPAIDSLLRYHFMGSARAEYAYTEDWSTVTLLVQRNLLNGANYVFFSDMLDDKILASMPHVQHRFDRSGSQIRVGHIHSTSHVDIIEQNINTIQGPVYVVDQIIVPDDFRMWHVK